MKTQELKRLLDACFVAKNMIETMPKLPKGMKPRHIHVLDAIDDIHKRNDICRVSDVASQLHITKPSVTQLIKELEQLGMLEKKIDDHDKRVVLLKLTAQGNQCVKKHVIDFHNEWVKNMKDISDEQVDEVIDVIHQLYATMPK